MDMSSRKKIDDYVYGIAMVTGIQTCDILRNLVVATPENGSTVQGIEFI